jgi:hypothetical protein
MQTITTIGFDIAKSIFQVHCVDAEGKDHRKWGRRFYQKVWPGRASGWRPVNDAWIGNKVTRSARGHLATLSRSQSATPYSRLKQRLK